MSDQSQPQDSEPQPAPFQGPPPAAGLPPSDAPPPFEVPSPFSGAPVFQDAAALPPGSPAVGATVAARTEIFPPRNGAIPGPDGDPQTGLIDYRRADTPHLGSGPLVGLEARNVSAWFGDHKVLERVSLNMQPGRVTALIGPSGCGKSTFLRILNRMHEMVRGAALAGEVLLAGEDIYDPRTRSSEVRRRIGMVFQKPNPFPAMSIYDNVASGLKLAGIKVKNKDQMVEVSLRRAGLWGEVQRRLRTPGGALSGGQQQRLCIARALTISPDVLLMDEPCSALDPTSTRRIEETITELQSQVTIVIVTHNMQQAQRVSSECAFFLAAEGTPGHIVESGATQQLFEAPTDPRTEDYVHGRFG